MRKRSFTEILIPVALLALLALALVLGNRNTDPGAESGGRSMAYERLFDTDMVHTLDIQLPEGEWEAFLATCTNEEYIPCTVVIDGEAMENVGLRAKGNSSMQRVTRTGNGRYSMKIEFDHYVDGQLYYGLDKLALNNLVQDDSGMKDYLTYRMMDEFGVAAPLCSYIYITVNGQDWGLFLAVEAVEDGFLQRNFGLDYGELYKPDTFGNDNGDDDDRNEGASGEAFGGMPMRASGEAASAHRETEAAETAEPETEAAETDTSGEETSSREMRRPAGGMGGGMMGSADLLLQYIDDDPESYPNVFGSAKTDVSKNDRHRLVASFKQLSAGENIPQVVDVEQVMRYFVVHGFTCNWDSYTGSMYHNYYLYEEDGRLSMIPWDYNEAYGSGGGGGGGNSMTSAINRPMDTPVSAGTVEDRPVLAWIFASEEYTDQYHDLYEDFLRQFIESGHMEKKIRDAAELIAPYVEKDPTKFCTYEAFLEGVDWMSEYFALRGASLRAQLEGTIPSTAEGQAADSSAFVDASSLGSSSGEMGGMRPGASGEASGEAAAEEETVVPDPNPPV